MLDVGLERLACISCLRRGGGRGGRGEGGVSDCLVIWRAKREREKGESGNKGEKSIHR